MFQDTHYGIESYVSENSINTDSFVARIIQKNNYLYTIATHKHIIPDVVVAHDIGMVLYVGDYVTYKMQDGECFLVELLERKNVISKASSHAAKSYHVNTYEQILATNVDQLYIIMAADQRFTLSKLERYVMTFNQPDLDINILISKADYLNETEQITKIVHSTYPHLHITPVSIYRPETIHQIKNTLCSGKTALFIGASGVGKSSLINCLIGHQSEDTDSVRSDGKGKHTTSVTKMVYVKGTDSFLIDSPGFKTIDTTLDMDGEMLFNEIQVLGIYCKFNDCTHTHEPGCAVKRAVNEGELSKEQLDRYAIHLKKLKGQRKHEDMKSFRKQKKFARKNK